MKHRLLLIALACSLLACATPTAVGHAPGTTPAERDRLHRETQRPEVAALDELTSTTVTTTFDVPHDHISTWFLAVDLADALPGTDELPGVRSTEMLSTSPWGQVGSRRRVNLDDDSSALEEIVVAELPDRVRYVVWNYTSDAAAYVRYGVGEFRFVPDGPNRTKVSWTYAFAPRGWPASWLLGGFVDGDYRDMMVLSLDTMKRLAESSYNRA